MEKQVEFEVLDGGSTPRCCSFQGLANVLATKRCIYSLLVGCLCSLAVAAYLLGRMSAPASGTPLPPELLRAAATHGGSDLAVATGPIDDQTEGIYFLDFKTGDLTCWVYYSRFMRFGAKYMCNVTEQLAATKNAEYLLVTGRVDAPPASSNNRPASGLVYVIDTKSGQFAAYTIANNRAMESAGQPQVGPILFVGGGEVRAPSAGSSRRTIPNGAAPNADANAPANPNGAAPANPAERKNNRKP